jgi:hypothetical protein
LIHLSAHHCVKYVNRACKSWPYPIENKVASTNAVRHDPYLRRHGTTAEILGVVDPIK